MRALESPRRGQEDAQGEGGGLRTKLGSPQAKTEMRCCKKSLSELEEKGGKSSKIPPQATAPHPERKNLLAKALAKTAAGNGVIATKMDCGAPCTWVLNFSPLIPPFLLFPPFPQPRVQ